jgi:hypothetical protein
MAAQRSSNVRSGAEVDERALQSTPTNLSQDEEQFTSSKEKAWEKTIIEKETGSTTALPLYKHQATLPPVYTDEEGLGHFGPAETAKDLVTEVIHARDDPTLNPWTFRVWFLGRYLSLCGYAPLTSLGIGLSTFGGSLATIYYFKPQTVTVSTVFLGVISYVLGEAMAAFIPRKTFVGRFLNPHPVCTIADPNENTCPLIIM